MDNFKAPEDNSDKLHFLDYWRIIRIRKMVILAVFFLVLITTAGVTYLLPKYYKGTTRMRVEKDSSDVDELMGRSSVNQFDPYWIQTEFEVIQSQMTLNRVITNLNLNTKWAKRYGDDFVLKTEETYGLLLRDLDVNQFRNTSIIEIEALNKDPQEAADLANEIASVYRDSRLNKELERSNLGIKALANQLEEQNKKIEAKENQLQALREKYNIVDMLPNQSIGAEAIEKEQVKQYLQMQGQAEGVFASKSALLSNLENLPREILLNTIITSVPDEQLSTLMQLQNRTEQELVSRRQSYTDEHESVKEANALLKKIEEQTQDRLDGMLQSLRLSVEQSKAQIELIEQKLDQAKKGDIAAGGEQRDYYALKREVENLNRLRDVLNLKIEQEKIDIEIPRSAIVTIIGEAKASDRHVKPNIMLNLILGCFVGLAVGVGLAFFIEYLDTSVKTIDDVERSLQAPVLGVIPQNVGSLLDEGPDSPHSEAYRVLRTNLLFSRKDETHNTITVVSGGAGEGKSTTLFNLATICAQNDSRVLVVDSDLRRPSIHKIVGVSNAIGLTNYLLDQNSLEEVIQTTSFSSLDVLPSGKLPSSSMGILNSPRMKELVSELKKRYDYVFFDSPPIMGVSDASVLASLVDITVQVIQYRKYPQAMTIRAKQMVEKVGKNLHGIVLNNINMSQDSDYYYYSGYYYDYYYSRSDDSADGEPKKNGKGKSHSPKETSRVDIKQKY